MLSLADMSAFEYLTLRNDAAARRLIAPEIEAFVAEDREHGGHLIATLLAYADADLNAKAAAEALLIHANTAHHRLGANRGEDRQRPAPAARRHRPADRDPADLRGRVPLTFRMFPNEAAAALTAWLDGAAGGT